MPFRCFTRGIPSLPGHDETETENFKGSDAGAIMWHDVPNSFIQSRALFRDGELPLWNRHNSCGLTLLGQGQSMFGDPLHGIVLFAGAAPGTLFRLHPVIGASERHAPCPFNSAQSFFLWVCIIVTLVDRRAALNY
jgi:hypothetical protein